MSAEDNTTPRPWAVRRWSMDINTKESSGSIYGIPLPGKASLSDVLKVLDDGVVADLDGCTIIDTSLRSEYFQRLRRALISAILRDYLFYELADALEELTALVRGECPSLLDQDRGGLGRLSNKIDWIFATIEHDRTHPPAESALVTEQELAVEIDSITYLSDVINVDPAVMAQGILSKFDVRRK